jgi:hypothetical protein
MSDGLDLPRQTMDFLTMRVVDWDGPIVEIVFNRRIASEPDVEIVLREAIDFMRKYVVAKAKKAYFVTCYDNLDVSRELLTQLQERFVEFNATFSLGDVRYGGTELAQMFVITTSIRSATRSNIFPGREQALAALRDRIRGQTATP